MPPQIKAASKTSVTLAPTTIAVQKVFVDNAISTTVELKIKNLMSVLTNTKIAMDKKVAELAGAPGSPVGLVEYGAGDGFKRRYQNGAIFVLPPAGPCWVHGAIYDEYVALGAEAGLLGYPTTDERSTPDGLGKYNHFERGSIYWSYRTGAHEIHGAIRDKWSSLGWEKSWLGFPTTGESGYTEDGRVSTFEHGNIYWWPDIGAYESGRVSLRFRGLYCFGETRGGGGDSPYAVMGLVHVPDSQGGTVGNEVRSQIFNDVDDGDSRPDNQHIYTGDPHGLAISVAVIEHDLGDPEKYMGLAKAGVDLAGKGVSAAAGALFGPQAAAACTEVWKEVGPVLASTVNDLFGTDDDFIGKAFLHLSAKEMITLSRQARTNFWGIQYHRDTELISDGDASYKAYFSIEPA